MITYYLPSSLFVVVSWTSFLIPSEDIQGRMALLVTLFLVLVRKIVIRWWKGDFALGEWFCTFCKRGGERERERRKRERIRKREGGR
jgi:hypothetical protein